MPRSKRTAVVHNAIKTALASLTVFPDSEEARELRERCLTYQATTSEWTHTAPTPEEREAMMKKVVALHVAVTKLRRKSEAPKREP